jgi:hypothetical protein
MVALALLAAAMALTLPLAGAATSVTLTVSTTPNAASARTPSVIGVNAGHRAVADTTWLAFMQHLGVNGAQHMFTPGAACTPLCF